MFNFMGMTRKYLRINVYKDKWIFAKDSHKINQINRD